MYLDRICLADIIGSSSFKQEIQLNANQSDWVKLVFFWAYALFQVPAGWLSDRFSSRMLITIYIATWSVFTAVTSFATGFWTLLLARLFCGLAEAGYYPAGSSLVTRWAHVGARGFASSAISWGGRVGGAVAPGLTASVIIMSGNWRYAGWLYGGAGILVAWWYWRVFRDHPREHPGCNAAEINLLAEGRGDFQPAKNPPKRFPLAAACRSVNLWNANAVQFFTNIGWAFLILYLSDYLKVVMHVAEKDASWITTGALSIGILALPLGGTLTDALSRRLGKRLGRMLPMSVTKFAAAACYPLALWTDSPWGMAFAFGLVTFFADFGLPAMWTTMQDISGKHQAQLFGWSNMWGNVGAGLMTLMFRHVVNLFDTNHDYHEGVWMCAGAFVLAGVFALFVNAEKPVIRESA
ncbi:MFS family permease [Prosthecobacter vanneervenii]|uniref:MFS family permease n=2 Tax=Prosthecobacter vanneervenii TaxID=48466 RepID=A0A7W8DMF5_9BACT|nr:MFS family permease [Prosthecobacter vanneervenii]